MKTIQRVATVTETAAADLSALTVTAKVAHGFTQDTFEFRAELGSLQVGDKVLVLIDKMEA
jgi:hypothetical protein